MLDAFTSGVNPDGLKSREDIKIFICYLLSSVSEELSSETLVDFISSNGFANYFEITGALEELEEIGNVIVLENGKLKIGENGRVVAGTLSAKLPATVKERAMNAAVCLVSRLNNEKENSIEITPYKKGYNVTCDVLDGELSLMSITVYAPDEANAKRIGDNFLDNPQLIYKTLLAKLLKDDGILSE